MEGAGRKNASKEAMVDRDGNERPKDTMKGALSDYNWGSKEMTLL